MEQSRHTETRAHNIILLRALTHRQVVSQTELPITVVAAERLIAVGSLFIICRHQVCDVSGEVASKRGGFGLWGIKRDNGAIAKTGAFAEGGGCYLFEEELLAGWILSQRPHDLVRSAVGIPEMALTRCYSK